MSRGMSRRDCTTLMGLVAAIVAGAVIGVATAPRRTLTPPTAAGQPSFVPVFTVTAPPVQTPLPTFTPGPEPTATTGALPTDQLPQARFTAVSASGTSVTVLPVEVPPSSEYGVGLSGRRSLSGRGMLFYFPDGKGTSGFWMKNTHVDLDVAFIDTSMTVIAVLQMQADTETVHRPGVPYLAAIEAPRGYYAAAGIGAGARVEFLFDVDGLTRR